MTRCSWPSRTAARSAASDGGWSSWPSRDCLLGRPRRTAVGDQSGELHDQRRKTRLTLHGSAAMVYPIPLLALEDTTMRLADRMTSIGTETAFEAAARAR